MFLLSLALEFDGTMCVLVIASSRYCGALRCLNTPAYLSAIFIKGNNFYDFLFVALVALGNKAFQNGSTCKRKNLLLEEIIL